jgi:hypothetical protein
MGAANQQLQNCQYSPSGEQEIEPGNKIARQLTVASLPKCKNISTV